MTAKVKCEYFENGNCFSILENAEAKEARSLNCSNDNEQACCYLCSYYHGCEISCNFLGENKGKIKKQKFVESSNEYKIRILRCPLCESKMLHSDANLRIGGWTGLLKLVPFGSLGELGEELLPVTLFICPKCGKIEFMAQEKTKQRIINRS
ncbi:MAG: hypothetical protein NWE95_08495 [Candidatus Bathyarchaeota archaeon]|nr:hypothetical protein [Candidatus Bathyarchaeota archaeon]